MRFQFVLLPSATAAAVLAVTALASSAAQAGPVSTMYMTSWSSAALYAIQGNTVSGTGHNTYCNHCEQPIAVDGDIRTIGAGNGYGGQYNLDLSQTGTTYAQPTLPGAASGLTDGTTDGHRNYAVAPGYGSTQSAVYAFDRDWGHATLLFTVDAGLVASGITYDPSNNSLWLQGYLDPLGALTGVLRDYDLGGGQLSSVNNLGGEALAMDYADNTFWVVRGPAQYFDQYSRDGTLLQTTSYDSLSGQNGIGAEFNLADAATVPEPGSLALAWAALGGLMLTRRRRAGTSKFKLLGAAALSISACSGAAQAALLDRGGGMIYDTDLNVTWLSNANLFGTPFAADPTLIATIVANVPTVSNGRTTHTLTAADFSSATAGNLVGLMSWWGATAYAENLNYGGYSDWRLPTSMQPDANCSQQRHINANDTDISYGFNCTGSELGHLFYNELGGTANSNLLNAGGHNAYFDLFSNVRTDYWTGTPFVEPGTGDAAWYFSAYGEQQVVSTDSAFSFGWLLRSGDVAAAVPEPDSLTLVLAGIAVLAAAARRPRKVGASGQT